MKRFVLPFFCLFTLIHCAKTPQLPKKTTASSGGIGLSRKIVLDKQGEVLSVDFTFPTNGSIGSLRFSPSAKHMLTQQTTSQSLVVFDAMKALPIGYVPSGEEYFWVDDTHFGVIENGGAKTNFLIYKLVNTNSAVPTILKEQTAIIGKGIEIVGLYLDNSTILITTDVNNPSSVTLWDIKKIATYLSQQNNSSAPVDISTHGNFYVQVNGPKGKRISHAILLPDTSYLLLTTNDQIIFRKNDGTASTLDIKDASYIIESPSKTSVVVATCDGTSSCTLYKFVYDSTQRSYKQNPQSATIGKITSFTPGPDDNFYIGVERRPTTTSGRVNEVSLYSFENLKPVEDQSFQPARAVTHEPQNQQIWVVDKNRLSIQRSGSSKKSKKPARQVQPSDLVPPSEPTYFQISPDGQFVLELSPPKKVKNIFPIENHGDSFFVKTEEASSLNPKVWLVGSAGPSTVLLKQTTQVGWMLSLKKDISESDFPLPETTKTIQWVDLIYLANKIYALVKTDEKTLLLNLSALTELTLPNNYSDYYWEPKNNLLIGSSKNAHAGYRIKGTSLVAGGSPKKVKSSKKEERPATHSFIFGEDTAPLTQESLSLKTSAGVFQIEKKSGTILFVSNSSKKKKTPVKLKINNPKSLLDLTTPKKILVETDSGWKLVDVTSPKPSIADLTFNHPISSIQANGEYLLIMGESTLYIYKMDNNQASLIGSKNLLNMQR